MSKNCYPYKPGAVLAWVIFYLMCSSARPAGEFPYMGTISGDRVNVRAGSSKNHEILCKLNSGERVAVRGGRGEWLKIVPPSPVRVWVWAEFVKEDVVVEDRVNVRARPALRSSVMCQVDRGDEVRVVDQQDEWLGIVPPPDCYAWVSAKYVEYAFPIKPSKAEEAEKLFRALEVRRKVFDRDDAGAVGELDDMVSGYKDVIARAPGSKAARQAKTRAGELAKIKKEMARAREKRRAILEKTPAVPVKTPAVEEIVAAGCRATGIVEKLAEPVDGVEYRLAGKRLFIKKVLCYLGASRINLDLYVGEKVTISGVVRGEAAGGKPVVEVENIVLE